MAPFPISTTMLSCKVDYFFQEYSYRPFHGTMVNHFPKWYTCNCRKYIPIPYQYSKSMHNDIRDINEGKAFFSVIEKDGSRRTLSFQIIQQTNGPSTIYREGRPSQITFAMWVFWRKRCLSSSNQQRRVFLLSKIWLKNSRRVMQLLQTVLLHFQSIQQCCR